MPRSDSDGPYKDGLCHRPAGWGTQHVGIGVCKLHGGNAPNVIKAAQKVMLEQGAATYGLPSNISPIEALTEELHRTHGHVLDRLFHLQMLTPDEVLSGPGADLRRNYLEERKHLVEVAQVLTRGGAEQQIGRYIGMQADLLDRGIAWLMAALGRDDPRAQVLLDHLLESLHRGEVPAALPAGEVVDADVVPTEGVGDG